MGGVEFLSGEVLELVVVAHGGIAGIVGGGVEGDHGAAGRGQLGQAGEYHVVEDPLGSDVVAVRDFAQRIEPVAGRAPVGRFVGAGIGLVVIPPGESMGETDDFLLAISGDRLADGIEHQRAVRVQPIEADAEQLQDFAGIVLIGDAAGGFVGPLVTKHIKIAAHRRMESHVFQQVAGIAEGPGQ